MEGIRKVPRRFPTKMLLKHRRVLLVIGLMAVLFAVQPVNFVGRIYGVAKDLWYTDAYLQTIKPVAIHNNTGQNNTEIACVIETSLGSCDGIGFASLVLQTIDEITTCLARGFVPTVIWTDCDYCGTPGPGVNYWTWYFKAINEGIEERAKTRVCVGPSTPLFYSSSLYLTRSGATGELDDFRFADMEHKVTRYIQPITAETRTLANYVISGYLKPADGIENSVDTFYQSFMDGYVNIGVHLRFHSGHVGEMDFFEQQMPKLQYFLQTVQRLINNIIATNTGKEIRIFVASDKDESIGVFKAEFGDNRVLNINALRGEEMSNKLQNKESGRLLGEQILTDILLLAKCDYLVHDESCVAALTYYYNSNITSYFVSGDPFDHKRLNAQPRFDSDELFRQAVAMVTSNSRVPSAWQESSFLIDLAIKCQVVWGFLNSDLPMEDVMCYYQNMKWSKCQEEFLQSQLAKNSDLRGLMNF
ncbi:PREDICTED: uncharacterized protein LOC109481128 [Branchiostoma belcheri]|uniref:Uncharacterized protein LOC109481128 n=1 Tax=Branchiostoma belcheri TaxID=7741 RepID=A0A6P4ZQT6_BRABE|nr:PREDICTED: uncharacterized protein LOC109481128 [Branchiostoma belcheri]